MTDLSSQAVRVHWYPLMRLTSQNRLPLAVFACPKEGIANRQNLMKPIKPLGLSPVIEMCIYVLLWLIGSHFNLRPNIKIYKQNYINSITSPQLGWLLLIEA
jgi:hypothetical protein